MRAMLLAAAASAALCAFPPAFAAESERTLGRPEFSAGMPRRYVLWEERGVFKPRTTTARAMNRFSGAVHAVHKLEIFLGKNGIHPLRNPFAIGLGQLRGDEPVAGLEEGRPGPGYMEATDLVPSGELEDASRTAD